MLEKLVDNTESGGGIVAKMHDATLPPGVEFMREETWTVDRC